MQGECKAARASSVEEGWYLGLMSGTSMDGVDAALLHCSSSEILAFGPRYLLPYSAAQRNAIAACLGQKNSDAPAVKTLEKDLTLWHGQAVRALMERAGFDGSQVRAIGFHGQTLFHDPEQKITLQIGDGQVLARLTGLPVVNQFRLADVAQGGQGAPLAPVYHHALAGYLRNGPQSHLACQITEREEAMVFVNIGGVSNITCVPAEGSGVEALLACDTGPGNALMDDWSARQFDCSYDKDGKIAASGQCDDGLLEKLLSQDFFEKPLPKSLDRNDFTLDALKNWQGRPEDAMATLAAFTAEAIAKVKAQLPTRPRNWLVTGGGRKNPFLMKSLEKALRHQDEVCVYPVEEAGFDGDALEAQAFAYLACRSLAGAALSWPSTTGAEGPCKGGILHNPTHIE